MAEGAKISIGDNTFSYKDFLENLGLWKEAPEKKPDTSEQPEEQKPE